MARRLSVRCDEVPEEETRARLAIAGRVATARVARAAAVARVPAEATTARVGARTVTANMFIRSIHTRGREVVCRLQCGASPIGFISNLVGPLDPSGKKEISYGIQSPDSREIEISRDPPLAAGSNPTFFGLGFFELGTCNEEERKAAPIA
jgi:hypothetical protein